jgi:hypothetical protein
MQTRFNIRAVHIGLVVGKVVLGKVPSLSRYALVFPAGRHKPSTPYASSIMITIRDCHFRRLY